MRSSIALFDDQYKIYKSLKSKRFLIACVEYMFEDIDPKNLTQLEQNIFDSMKKRMENWKKNFDRNSLGGRSSHGGGRKGNQSSELSGENSLSNSLTTTKEQPKNKEVEVEVEDIKKENNKLFSKESPPPPPSKKNQTSLSIPTVDELYDAYLKSPLYQKVNRLKYSDNGAIKLRLERKQSGKKKKDGKKVDAYTTVNGRLRTLKIMINTVCPGHEMLDAGRRLEFAINNSLLKYDGIFREQKQEDQYLATIETENKDFYI